MALLKIVIALTFGASVSGCVAADPNTLSDAVKENSPLAYPNYRRDRAIEIADAKAELPNKIALFYKCVTSALPKIDDKISDAKTIALAATNACFTEYESYVRTASIPLTTPVVKQQFAIDMNSDVKRADMSLNEVLKYRANGAH